MAGFLHLPALAGFGGALVSGRVGSIIYRRRNTLALAGDALAGDASVAEDLGDIAAYKARIQAAAPSVGKIELILASGPQVVATCFRVGAGQRRIVTARHVAEVLLQEGASLAPGLEPKIGAATESRRALREHRVVFEKTVSPLGAGGDQAEFVSRIEKIELVHGEHDLMLAMLASNCPRPALPLAAPARAREGARACVIGYPVKKPTTGEEKELFEALFTVNGVAQGGIKRASPGLLGPLRNPPDRTFSEAAHDATTLPGSSGSPVIAIDGGGILGIHTQGRQAGDRNRMIYLPAVLLEEPLRQRFDPDHAGAEAGFPGWPAASILRGRVVRSGETADEGLELSLPTSLALDSAAPGCFAYSPAVMSDRRDLRDRYYTPSLRIPRAGVSARAIEGRRIQRQGVVADCTGCAMAAAIDIALAKQGRKVCASARMLYEMARVHDEFVDDEPQGSSLRGGIKGFYHNGVCEVSDADANGDWHLSIDRAKEARNISLGAYFRLRPSLPDFQMAIQEVGAVIVSAWTHLGWTDPPKGRIPHRRDRRMAHAFVLVGYDEHGFLVQNSWGADWGLFRDRPGTAHWTYADWAENVIDAWVLQTAPSAPKAHNLPLRAYQQDQEIVRSPQPPEIAALPEPRRLAVIGHVAHAERAGLIDAGRIGVGPRALRETALYLARNEVWARSPSEDPDEPTAYCDIAFLFHDPMLGADAAARLSAHVIPRFKAAGVYPMNILYGADEIRSLTVRVAEEASFADDLSRLSGEDLTGFIERRARTVGGSMLAAFLAGIDEAARPGGALWQIIASFGYEAVLPPEGVEARPRGLHVVAFGTGALPAAAAFRDPAAIGLLDDRMPAPLLKSVTLVGPVAPDATQWPLAHGKTPLTLRLGPNRPLGAVMPGYRGDWGDLLSAMLPGGGGRETHGRATGPETLAALATQRKTLNMVMRRITGRTPNGWISF